MPYYINPPPPNLLSRIVAAIIAVFVLIGSFMIGMAALLVIGGVALIAGIALWARIAWIKRRLRKEGVDMGAGSRPFGTRPTQDQGNVIDAEYTVISEDRDEPGK